MSPEYEFELPADTIFLEGIDLPALGYETVKRFLDITLAIVGFALLWPLLVLVAIAIKLHDYGPVLFVQERVGRNGTKFKCVKFRTMMPNADQRKWLLLHQSHHGDSITFKIPQDPRITRIGRLLRKTSIDELMQLWNVLAGDMSIVGPRPAVPSEVAMYANEDRRRLLVRPGLTCIWQVSGRGDLPFSDQVRLDLDYIQNRSLWLDVKLIGKTIPAVLSGRGAY